MVGDLRDWAYEPETSPERSARHWAVDALVKGRWADTHGPGLFVASGLGESTALNREAVRMLESLPEDEPYREVIW